MHIWCLHCSLAVYDVMFFFLQVSTCVLPVWASVICLSLIYHYMYRSYNHTVLLPSHSPGKFAYFNGVKLVGQ